MAEALKCPACSAPLKIPVGGGPTFQCPYCNSTVLVPGAGRAAVLGSGAGGIPDIARIATSTARFTMWLTIGIIVFVGIIVAIVTYSASQQAASQSATPQPMAVAAEPAEPAEPVAPPAPPAFAHMVQEFGSEGMGPGQFTDCRSVAIDGNGHIYVGDYSGGRVDVFDSNGKFLRLWTIGPNKYLMNLTATRNGTVFVTTPGHIYAYEGTTGRAFGEAQHTDDDGNFVEYEDAYAALTGDIYTIAGQSDIVILDSDGKMKSVIHAGDKVGESLNLQRIVVNGDGEIYALDQTKGIFQFAPDGRYINRFTPKSDIAGVTVPRSSFNLAVDGKGRLLVSGADPAVEVFNSDGQSIGSFGENEVAFGMAITDQNEILACFRNRHTVRKYAMQNP